MDIYEQLSQQIHRLRSFVRELQADPRCIEDNDLENAVQRLNSFARDESQKLTDLETNYFVEHKAVLEVAAEKLAKHTDQLGTNLESAKTAVEIIGAIEALLKACHPLF